MKILIILVSIIGLTVVPSVVRAQNTPAGIVEKFFSYYKVDSVEKGLDYLFSTNPYFAASDQAVASVKTALENSQLVLGSCINYELLEKDSAGPDVVLLKFIVKHAREPLIFRFLFYRPLDMWQLQNFTFDEKIDEELENTSKTAHSGS